MNPSSLLAPKVPPHPGRKGKLPHHKYRLVRSRVEHIIQARDDLSWSDNQAALRLGFRSAAEFAEAYGWLKDNARRLVEDGDWSGVEAAVYARFPEFESDQKFRCLLKEFGDTRMKEGGRLFNAPVAPVRLPPPPMPAPLPPPMPAPMQGGAPSATPTVPSPANSATSETATPVEPTAPPQKRWGRSSDTVSVPVTPATS